jgi:hypothetical protein
LNKRKILQAKVKCFSVRFRYKGREWSKRTSRRRNWTCMPQKKKTRTLNENLNWPNKKIF